jgi:hypothetical protein
LFLKNDVIAPSKSNEQNKFLLAAAGSGPGSGPVSQRYRSADPDPYRLWIRVGLDPENIRENSDLIFRNSYLLRFSVSFGIAGMGWVPIYKYLNSDPQSVKNPDPGPHHFNFYLIEQYIG